MSRFECKMCNKLLSSSAHLEKHLRTIHQPKEFTCDFEGKRFNSKDKLRLHMFNHRRFYRIRCEVCEREYKTDQSMRKHLRTHFQQHQCDFCGQVFKYKRLLANHIGALHEDAQEFQCKFCTRLFPNTTTRDNHQKHMHKSGVRNTKLFQCVECAAGFEMKEELRLHSFIHFEGVIHTCLDCNQIFKKKKLLTLHMKKHEMPAFSCTECKQMFKYKSNLNKHLRRGRCKGEDVKDTENGLSEEVALIAKKQMLRITKSYTRSVVRPEVEGEDVFGGDMESMKKNMKENKITVDDQKNIKSLKKISKVEKIDEGEEIFEIEKKNLKNEQNNKMIENCQKNSKSPKTVESLLKFSKIEKVDEIKIEKSFTCEMKNVKENKMAEDGQGNAKCQETTENLQKIPEVKKIDEEILSNETKNFKSVQDNKTIENDQKIGKNLSKILQIGKIKDFETKDILNSEKKNSKNVKEEIEEISEDFNKIGEESQRNITVTQNPSQDNSELSHQSRLSRTYTRHRATRITKASPCTPYECDLCGSSFAIKSKLLSHIRQHISTTRHRCQACGDTFSSMRSLHTHSMRAHSRGVFGSVDYSKSSSACEQCGKVLSAARMKSHLALHATPKVVCDHCGQLYRTRAALERHLAVATAERTFTCAHCGKSFKRLSVLRQHEETHNPIKIYIKCEVCARILQMKHLRMHMEVQHGGRYSEKRFACENCGKEFRYRKQLEKHTLQVHEAQTRGVLYACGDCERVFTRRHELRNHSFVHYAGSVFECGVCGLKFKKKKLLYIHSRVHSASEATLPCDECQAKFKTRGGLRKHKARMHGKNEFGQ